jgi:hypothetical protein
VIVGEQHEGLGSDSRLGGMGETEVCGNGEQ